MKLFGNKKNAARTAGARAASAPSASGSRRTKKRGMSGVAKGCLLLLASMAGLAVTIFAVYKDFVKPMEIPQPSQPDHSLNNDPGPNVPEDNQNPDVNQPDDDEIFKPPTEVDVVVQVNPNTGEEEEVEVEVPSSHKTGFYNILVVGTDDDGTRTDTIIIARIDVNDHTVALLSVPRDTLIGTSGSRKINSVYGSNGKNTKGMEALKKSLAALLGFEVDGYVLVDLDAFIELVDLVDGVDFNVPQRMYYNDPTQNLYIDLYPGEQHLNGQKAMQLVRFRGYAAADIQRTKVQQDFLRALAKKCLSVTTLTKIGGLADIFSKNVLTDLSVGNIAYFGQELLKCDFDQMYTHTLEGEGLWINGTSVWALYQNKTLNVINKYFNPYQAQITAANVSFRTPEYLKSLMAPADPDDTDEPTVPDEPVPEPDDPFTDPGTDPDEPDPDPDEPIQPDDPILPDDPFSTDEE